MRARHHAARSDEDPVTLRGGALRKVQRDARDSERESGPQLKAAVARNDRATQPPEPIEVEHIHLGVSVDELLYRYDMGDIAGALSVGLPLLDEDYIPAIITPQVVLSAMPLSGREEYVLSLVDGWSTLAELVEISRLSTLDTLRTFCELIEKRVVGLG
jgi:hypothetical protein